MRKKNKKLSVMLMGILSVVFLMTGCGQVETVEADSKKSQEMTQNEEKKEKEKEKKIYTFVDVLGEEYEAELLEEVPTNTYDLSRIVEENGYKYYMSENGEKESRLGIDVSEYQPQVDWQQVRNAGIDFVMIRLGYRGYGEKGTLVEDSMFRQHVENALTAGLDVGVFFFSQAITDEEVEEEADFVLERIKDYQINCPVVFDTEEIKFDTARTDNLSGEQFTKNCRIFCDRIQNAGYDTMIYANMKWMAFTLNLEELTEYEKWYADYEPKPQCPYEFSMWQYTETGSVPGIEGNVDLNVWFPKSS